ncbi:FadR family transcriptional regulator [Rhizobium pusense]|uniref:FadR/GntR family transcriptional regulator n=1 Tax=Agrobacterium pusense TaxID=648995 RepID=UPI001C6E48CA|nr:FadR/GntR family transcriptional regulator [Agrobacterium pusense]MBW9080748.1 FadR family transcriptional regulator [Agrobacterium pusense]
MKNAAGATEGLFETGRPGGLHERVYRSLVHAITSGKYEVGSKLPTEAALALAYEVSRPVLRQAMERLRVEGLIESRRGAGSFVVEIGNAAPITARPGVDVLATMRRMMDDLEFRTVVEPEVAFLAARRRGPVDLERMETALKGFEAAHKAGAITHHFDFLFHEALAMATTNERFVSAIRSLEYGAEDGRVLARDMIHFQPQERGDSVLQEHVNIFELIKKRDDKGARNAMSRHIESARLRHERFMKDYTAS